MLDYLKRLLIAGIMALCVSLLFFGGKPQAESLEKAVDWIWPTDGVISDTFGTRFGHHKGIDIAGSLNSPIFAVDEGRVTKSYFSDTYGHVVFIKHKNNLETVYAHLNKRMVKEGQTVKKGAIIGQMGDTGKSDGVHLHFEVHENEWTYDKENALNPSLVLGSMKVGNIIQANIEENAQFVVKDIKQSNQLSEEAIEENLQVHIIKPGESLWSIAENYSTTVETLQRVNTLTSTKIYEKQTIKIPKEISQIYVVQNGDTLTAISKKTNQSINNIKRYNHLKTDDIYPFQKINIPIK